MNLDGEEEKRYTENAKQIEMFNGASVISGWNAHCVAVENEMKITKRSLLYEA